MSEKISRKVIIVSSCMKCPLIKDCKAWKNLTPNQRFSLKVKVGIGDFILKDCPLSDEPKINQP
jgi:hypothetical protein